MEFRSFLHFKKLAKHMLQEMCKSALMGGTLY